MTRRESYLFIALGVVCIITEVCKSFQNGNGSFSLAGPIGVCYGIHALVVNATIKKQNEMWFCVLGLNKRHC